MTPDNMHLHQLLFSFFNKINIINKKLINTFTGFIINFFNLIIFTFVTIYYYNTKIQILIILISLITYNIIYYIFAKEIVSIDKKNL